MNSLVKKQTKNNTKQNKTKKNREFKYPRYYQMHFELKNFKPRLTKERDGYQPLRGLFSVASKLKEESDQSHLGDLCDILHGDEMEVPPYPGLGYAVKDQLVGVVVLPPKKI